MKRLFWILTVVSLAAFVMFAGGQQEPAKEESAPQQQAAEKAEPAAPAPSGGGAGEIFDPNIPQSWYGAPKPASEMGITEFRQSPMLDRLVASGELPPVEERLPEDPPVVEPLGEVGKYGGTAITWSTALNLGGDARYLVTHACAARGAPDGSDKVPFLLEGWTYSNNYQDITLHIRPGMKWSDGTPLTSADYTFWFEHYAKNTDLQPTPPDTWTFPLLDVVAVDEYNVTLKFGKPYKKFAFFQFQDHMGAFNNLRPSEFAKQYHPDFIGMDKAQANAEAADLDNWYEFYTMMVNDSYLHPEYEAMAPQLRPYVVVSRSETNMVLERNPYYPFVDTAGNQLPYIDRVEVKLANSADIAEMKASTGEATLAARYTQFSSLPLYKNNEQNENYSTFVYKKPDIDDFGIHFNMTVQNDDFRPIFQDKRFRQAMSMGFDRDEINEKLFFGTSTPSQVSVLPTSPLHRPEWTEAYASYEPDRAEALLDELGLKDINNDGFRELPNGDKFVPTFMYCETASFDCTGMLEIIKDHWSKIGINVNLKMVSRQLHDQLVAANDFDISGFKCPTADWRIGDQRNASFWLAPVNNTSVLSPWPAWESWVMTGGESGMEPPPEIKELVDIAHVFLTTLDDDEYDEALTKLLEAQAENLWTIGTVGLSGHPIIVNNNLKNVPTSGFWEWGLRFMQPMYPMQFYLDE